MKKSSPYLDYPLEEWKEITENLIADYPLEQEELLEIALISWRRILGSEIGEKIKIHEVELPSTVVGYFFQKLFSHELSSRYPDTWQGETHKADKDLVNIKNSFFSTEMKASGQMGYSVFGNRSYNQEVNNTGSSKDKSGYYITLNFYGQTINLLRLGWVDQDDWIPQGAQSGQAAILKPEVYSHKLITINGDYRHESPIQLLSGVGPKAANIYNEQGIYTFLDLINYEGDDKKLLKIVANNQETLDSIK